MVATRKSAEDFRRAAKEHNIVRWGIRDCSICGYGLAYDIDGEKITFDSGCHCVDYQCHIERTWQDLADHYNLQTDVATIERYNEFWGFK